VPKILIADDNTNIQKMVSLALEERGIQVVSVGNGEAAVRRIPDVDPDLVLADIFMPVRNGYEVCEFVKKDQRFSHVPVILLVGAFDPLDEKEARRVGADGVLKKPFVPPDPLIAMVTSALEKNPRVAAELAKAKEAKEQVVETPPAPELEIPARAEPKPLPEFPEPTPEEAALVYGFGKGQRTLEDEPEAAKAPKATFSESEAEEEELDEASTAKDWRRSAMDFEIPADAANKPAFSSDDMEPASFPSESDYPPRHVSVSDADKGSLPEATGEAIEQTSSFSSAPIEASVEEPAEPAAPMPIGEIMPKVESCEAPAVTVESDSERSAISNDAPPIVPAAVPEATHWMDAVAKGASDYPPGGWMSALSEQQAGAEVAERATVAPAQEQSAPGVQTDQQDGFFADEPAPGAATVAASPTETVPEAEIMPTEAAAEPLGHQAAWPERALEPEPISADAPVSFKDPALVEPPAVRVTPEPLLMNEEVHGPSDYAIHPQETAPIHSFFAALPPAPATDEESAAGREPEVFPWEQTSEPEVNERIPTMPPPNREALKDIPFLVPPPSITSGFNESESSAADPATVDAVVRKVMEKLGPQLHDLLSQSVLKPLVENLLQNETAKKVK
jgi:CheY-like chemotaxis protein